jgi:ligand-binding sensor domain-containing protein
MKQYFHFFFLLLFFSCNAQVKKQDTQSMESSPNGIPFLLKDSLDNDPYFIPIEGVTSSFGPRDITRNIVEDKNGIIWLASWNGIMGYDGKNFTNYTNKEHLRRYHVFSICEERKTGKNGIWFGTIRAGAYRYDGNKFTNFTTKDGLADDIITTIFEDKNGNIWFGTGNGVSRYDGNKFTNFTEKDGLVGFDFNNIIQDKNGTIWLASRDGVTCYDGNVFKAFKKENGANFINVRSILEDKNGAIWLGGQEGLFRYDGKKSTAYTKDFIGFLYEDKKGMFYISAASANNPRNMILYCFDTKTLPSPMLPAKMSFSTIVEEKGQTFGILEDKNGNIWYGRERGVCRYDGQVFTDFLEKMEK